MKLEELYRVLSVISNADGGCPICTKELYEQLKNAFPELRKHITKWVEEMDAENE